MGDPELRNDEKILVRTPGVYVKSIPFEGILTNKRVILVDRAKNLLPPKEIPLATVKEVESGENAIRDQTLTLSVMAKTGETRQMILTFSRQEGGNRIKERDEWARYVRDNIGASFETVIRKVIPGADVTPRRAEQPAVPSRTSVMNSAAQPAPVYRESESVHPTRKIMDTGAAPAPDQFVFCSRCGNKVPHDSAFCNRCGSPIVAPAAASAPVAPAPAQVSLSPPLVQTPAPSVPNQRPIDRQIQAIEPLIERSKERIPADPLRKTIPDVPVPQSLSWDEEEVPYPAAVPVPVTAPATTPSAPVTAEEKPEKNGFLPRIFSPKAKTQAAPVPAAAPPVPERPKRSLMPGKNILMAIGAVIIIIAILAIGVVFVLPMLSSGGIAVPGSSSGDATPAPTSSSSSGTSTLNPSGTIVPVETEVPVIPPTGVYVHVNYIAGFEGKYGMPDSLTIVPGNSMDRVWEVEKANGTVIAEFKKQDGSKHDLLVEIYKDGTLLTKGSTTIGHGEVKLSVDTDTGIAQEPVASNSGAAATTTAVTTTAVSSTTAAATTTTVAATSTTTAVSTTTAATTTTASP